jgi:hypothetical protein
MPSMESPLGFVRSIVQRLDEVGYEKSRRALAALALSFFITVYLLVALNAPPGWGRAFLALSVCYLVAFLALASEWFWGRWFASGLGWSGVMVAIATFVMIGWSPPILIYGLLHGLVVVTLSGKKMAAQYDLQDGWRQRYGMDEFGVARLRKTVTRAAMSLPSLILWALAPKEGQGAVVPLGVTAIATALLAVAGLRGVIRLRSWGLIAMALASVGLFAAGMLDVRPVADLSMVRWLEGLGTLTNVPNAAGIAAPLTGFLLATALLPFAGPAVRFLRQRT